MKNDAYSMIALAICQRNDTQLHNSKCEVVDNSQNRSCKNSFDIFTAKRSNQGIFDYIIWSSQLVSSFCKVGINATKAAIPIKGNHPPWIWCFCRTVFFDVLFLRWNRFINIRFFHINYFSRESALSRFSATNKWIFFSAIFWFNLL